MDVCLIRVDANANIGAGHLMRCIALAQSWRDAGGSVLFALHAPSQPVESILQNYAFPLQLLERSPGSVEDLIQTLEIAVLHDAKWVVVDGYHFNSNFLQGIKDKGYRLLCIDDYGHADRYTADVVVNQNLHANEILYPIREPYTTLLLGIRYILLRREFLRARITPRSIQGKEFRILTSFGGSDPMNLSLKMIDVFAQLQCQPIHVKMVLGPMNPHVETIRKAVNSSSHTIDVIPSADNIPELMVWSELAVTAGGSTCWELCYMGVPMLVFIAAQNQEPVASSLEAYGCAYTMGWGDTLDTPQIAARVKALIHDHKKRHQMASNASDLVDGLGADRVVECMKAKDGQS